MNQGILDRQFARLMALHAYANKLSIREAYGELDQVSFPPQYIVPQWITPEIIARAEEELENLKKIGGRY